MKLRKGLFMLCAGLSLCACSSDDETSVLDKEGAVEVTIVPPVAARSLTEGSTGNDNKIKVTGDMYVTLTYGEGGNTTVTKKIASDSQSKSVKFWGISKPKSVSVTMNGGIESYSETSITAKSTKTQSYVDEAGTSHSDTNISFDMQATPSNIPVYGITGDFTLTSDIETNNGTNYQMYTASVELVIPVARLEISVLRQNASTLFSAMNLKGIYLDNIKSTGDGNYSIDYKHPTDESTSAQNQTTALLYDTNDPVIAFTNQNTIAPNNTQYYAYNFYGWDGNIETKDSAENPEVKLYFTGVTAVQGQPAVPANQYAIINQYKNTNDQVITLQNGKIYKIVEIGLADTNVGPVESGEDIAYAVTATVVEAVWDIETITGVWN